MPIDIALRASAVPLDPMSGLALTQATGSSSVSSVRLQDQDLGVFNDRLEKVRNV